MSCSCSEFEAVLQDFTELLILPSPCVVLRADTKTGCKGERAISGEGGTLAKSKVQPTLNVSSISSASATFTVLDFEA